MTDRVENRPFDRLRVGDSDSIRRKIRHADLQIFVTFAGNVMDHAVDRQMAADTGYRAAMSTGGLAQGLVLALVSTRFPGPGTSLQSLRFDIEDALTEGDVAVAEARVTKRDEKTGTVTLDCHCAHADGRPVLRGRIVARAPDTQVSRPFGRAVALGTGAQPDRFERIEEMGRAAGPIRMAVVNPVDAPSLDGALDSAQAGLIEPVLIAPRAALEATADAAGVHLAHVEIIDVTDARAAAQKAAALAAKGDCAAIMKGKLHTDTLLRAVLDNHDLRTHRRLSHVFVEDVPGYPRLLFVADGAVNIAPDLMVLRDIVQNAVDLARALGVERPKVAMLSAVESVTPDIPSTINAAAICKMADRGDITGADIDGPLALDNAVSEQAARIKGITSRVAGHADILIAPDLEAANILAKDLDHLAGADAAGIALGASVPIALTSRADTARERRASAAVAAIVAGNGRTRKEEQT
ncbi:MAG: bifunctional enoyl-CoA hydratase/phosphate acetyltransferase [Rhodobacteraceae bacterium]|nr:bifunctional enoyl-CoA hydratase/phosphate acetyltransferase [Paracoccaceae bacterium]